MEDDVQKEEQRLMRTMNNRVNAALQNKPKANFTFNIGGGAGGAISSPSSTSPATASPQRVGVASPSPQTPPVASPSAPPASSYASPPINFSAPQNFANIPFGGAPPAATSSLSSSSARGYAAKGGIPPSRSNENIKDASSFASPSTPSPSSSSSLNASGSTPAAPEVVKHSHQNPEEEMKALFADDRDRRMKMEEDRLTRSLGKRSYVAPKSSAPPVAAQAPARASTSVPVHHHASSPAAAQPAPSLPHADRAPAPAPLLPFAHAEVPVAATPVLIIESEAADAAPAAVVLVDTSDDPSSIMNTIDDVLNLAKDIGELQIPITPRAENDDAPVALVQIDSEFVPPTGDGENGYNDVEVSVVTNDPALLQDLLSDFPLPPQHHHADAHAHAHADAHAQAHAHPHAHAHVHDHPHAHDVHDEGAHQHPHPHAHEGAHVNVHADVGGFAPHAHGHAQAHAHAHTNANVNVLADIIGNIQQESKIPADVLRFKNLVDSVAKILKGETPINGDEALTTLETIGKVVIGIVPTIQNPRHSADVKVAAVELVKESILFKQAWQNWSDMDEILPRVIAKLGVLYINVTAAF